MKLTLATLTGLLAASASAITVSYDPMYDNASQSMNTVACSDGSHGLAARFPTFGKVPKFPDLGGASTVASWNSANCGKCYSITYNGRTVNMLAVDHAGAGFNLSFGTFNWLTRGQGKQLGRIDATWKEAPASNCGL